MLQRNIADRVVSSEPDIKHCVRVYVQMIQNMAAIGEQDAPLPSDDHAELIPVEAGPGNCSLEGVPDFALRSRGGDKLVTAVVEVKNPWVVTPRQIDQVIDGTHSFVSLLIASGVAPVSGLHVGRLAVEQLYGYMIRNSKVYGILTTWRGWCFAMRRDGR